MSIPLPLHTQHEAHGAVFEWLAEREAVSHYGDPMAEARALRLSAGVMDWSCGTRLKVTHSGTRTAIDFVEGLLSNTILKRGPNEGCYATLLTHTGKVLADCHAWIQGDAVLLATESGAGPVLRDSLTKYGFLDDIVVTDSSDTLGLLGLYGPDALVLWERATGAALPELAPLTLVPLPIDAGDVRVVASEVIGKPGIHVFGAPDTLGSLWDALTNAGATPVGMEAFHTARIEAGTPWVGFELDDRVLPNAAGAENAISYTKGCYVGQEAVAKLHYLGRSNYALTGLRLGDMPPPTRDTTVVLDGKEIGRITSSAVSPACHETIALAHCKVSAIEGGDTLMVDGAPAAIAKLPFA